MLSFLYSASVMPELVARIRSGASSATSCTGMPSESSYRSGASPPTSASSASNQSEEPSSLPPQVSLVAPTGTTPRASALSWSVQPRVATRLGSDSIVVSPKACSMVTGKAPSSTDVVLPEDSSAVSVEPVLQAVSRLSPARAVTSLVAVRRMLILELGKPYRNKVALSARRG